jgi:hypothetical protein
LRQRNGGRGRGGGSTALTIAWPNPPCQLERVRAFFALHNLPAADRAIHAAQEKIRIHAARIAREGPQLEAWLGMWQQAQAVAPVP